MALSPLPRYSLVEANGFTGGVKTFGGYRRLDDAMTSLSEILCNHPEIYPVVDGMTDVRLCKTDYTGDVPAARWWFKIKTAEERIELLWVEVIEDSDAEG